MSLPRRGRSFFAVTNLLSAALVGAVVFRGLPARWWPVDVGAAVVVLLLLVAGVLLLLRHARAPLAVRISSGVVLALGLAFTAATVATATWLATVYGPVGRGGSAVFAVFVLLAVPYVVVLPAAQLVWLGRRP